MIIPTTTIILVQAIMVTWIMVTAPEPCPKEYMKYTQLVKVCKLQWLPSGGSQWVLREE
jgi:hypothetical protein